MTGSEIASVFGMAISVGTFVYMAGFWKRGVEDNIGQIQKDVTEIRGDLKARNLASFCMMVQTLWDVYVLDPLHKRTDIAQFQSPPKLTQKGLDYIPADIKEQLDQLAISVKNSLKGKSTAQYLGLADSANLMIQVVGLDKITKVSQEKELSIQEMIAVLSTYLSNRLS
jgi:hypothetical protein